MAKSDLRILALVMAGGEGRRLLPLTLERSKPAVPFGGSYRIVDFVLSNFLNSGIYSQFVLVQYRSQSLIHHLREGWRISTPHPDDFLTIVPPQMRVGTNWYRGTADAVYQNFNLIYDFRPDLIAVFGADHIYRMHIGHMIRFHRKKQADVSVAMLPVPREEATGFGVAETEPDDRIIKWWEKPEEPPEMPGRPGYSYSSMGNYIFEPGALVEILRRVTEERLEPDFGKTIVPLMAEDPQWNVFAYDFLRNQVPGVHPYEERGYWRDVGTLESYWAAHQDLLGREPRFDLNNRRWPIHTPVLPVRQSPHSQRIAGRLVHRIRDHRRRSPDRTQRDRAGRDDRERRRDRGFDRHGSLQGVPECPVGSRDSRPVQRHRGGGGRGGGRPRPSAMMFGSRAGSSPFRAGRPVRTSKRLLQPSRAGQSVPGVRPRLRRSPSTAPRAHTRSGTLRRSRGIWRARRTRRPGRPATGRRSD